MASTSNIQNSPSSLSSSCSEYEVFLSFGDDTRNTFTDHLYHALASDKGIITFRDNEGLDRGKSISLEVLNAIEKSRIAFVIFSEKYASSNRRLEELAKIVECMGTGRMRVLPVFYHVDPCDVRYLKGTFAGARLKEERWRAALRRVADLSGHHLKDESESQFIQRFVEKISSELNDTIESVYKDKHVGMESRVEEFVNLYIDMEPKDDVRFIGICGKSGVGKTTLAEVVFERIRRKFQASSFLRDVKKNDLGDSQDQLLWDMKLKSEIPRWDELKAINMTSRRLRNKRVIIVVDDVDEEKLEKLAGYPDWFGPGSRIIITTEDEVWLQKKCRKKNVYKANNHENEGKASTSNTFNDEDTHPERLGSNEDLHNIASIRPRNQCNLPDFDPCLVYNSCFPPNEILEWFSHLSDKPQVIIYLPPNLYDDPSWKGLALCVSFSLQEHGTTIVDNLDSQVPCKQLIFLLETAIGSLELLHKYCPTKEDLTLLRLGGFIWLSYIPRGSFPNCLIHSNFIEASIATDIPGLTLHKCGFRLLYKNEEREFKETVSHYTSSLSKTRDVIHQSNIANEKMVKPNQEDKAVEPITASISDEVSHLARLRGSLNPRLKDKGKNDPHNESNLPDFDRRLVYNFCFPPNEILDWFNYRSNKDLVTISDLPPNLYDDCTWMGLTLCVSFSVEEHGTTIVNNRNLPAPCGFIICKLETDICGPGHVHMDHTYYPTKEYLMMLLRPGGFIWLSYIPRELLRNRLNYSSFIEASIGTDLPGLTVQKYGFHLLYENEEIEFKEIIMQLSQTQDGGMSAIN